MTAMPEELASPQPRRARRWRVASWAPVMVLILLCIIITFINPNFMTFGNLVRISQSAMIPLVLGIGATFIILMGSIDLSVEGVLTLGAVMLSMLVLNGANANDYGIIGVFIVLLTGAAVGFINGVIHVRLKVPSFMATLGTWFIGVGIANALLGGMATRINDPWIRGLAVERFLGFPWGVWLALFCLAVALVIQTIRALAATSMPSAVARNLQPFREFQRRACGLRPSPWLASFMRWRNTCRRPTGTWQCADRQWAAVHHDHGGGCRRHIAFGRARQRAANPVGVLIVVVLSMAWC